MNELALFAGAGGGILGGKLLGWRTVCAVEITSFCARRLMQRQNEGHLSQFPIWDDVRSFDGHPWRGVVDVVSGGFPCQDISSAGRGVGITGERSGLWSQMARIIGEVEPRWVLVENSPLLTSRGLGTVLRDLAQMGYDAEWGVLGAIDAGAPHKRDRIWIVAYRNGELLDRSGTPRTAGWLEPADSGEARDVSNAPSGRDREELPRANIRTLSCSNGPASSDSDSSGLEERDGGAGAPGACAPFEFSNWWSVEPRLGRVAHGVAHRVDRLRAIGNGQVPAVAAMAFRELSSRMGG